MTAAARRAPVIAALVGVSLLAACAPDPHDVYTVDDLGFVDAPTQRTDVAAGIVGQPDIDAFDRWDVVDVEIDLDDVLAEQGELVVVHSPDANIWGRRRSSPGPRSGGSTGAVTSTTCLPVDRGDFGVERKDFEPGDEYAHVFDEPGVYPYYCSIHGTEDVGMVGTIIVTAPT